MQDDLNALSLWCEKWNIGQNVAKYRLSLKQKTSHYSVQDNSYTIEQVNSYCNLGSKISPSYSKIVERSLS